MDLQAAFDRGGETGALIRSIDWSATPLGPTSSWPDHLRSAMELVLCSGFPQCLIWGYESSEAITIYNDAFIPFLGKKKHPSAMGKCVRDVWPEIWDFLDWALKQVWRTGRPVTGKDVLLLVERSDYLEEIYASLSQSAVWDRAGNVCGSFGCWIETTGQVHSERRERVLKAIIESAVQQDVAQDELFRAIAAALASNTRDVPFALLYIVDPSGKWLSLEAATGLRPGTSASPQKIEMDDRAGAPWPVSRVVRTGEPEMVAANVAAKFFGPLPSSGFAQPQSAAILPVKRLDRDARYGVLVLGLTPLRAYDDTYRAFGEGITREIASALANIEARQEARERAQKLAELDQAKTEFLGNVSHEFRTPLTLILGPVEDMLQDPREPLGEWQRAQLESVRRNSQRLLKLVNALLDFARIEAGRAVAVFEPTDLAELTTELASAFDIAAERAGIHLRIDCPPLPEPVFVDRDMWEKIVLNLVSNAMKFTRAGEISVILRLEEDSVRLSVHDTGTGIPPNVLEHIFERFYRAPKTNARTQEGAGIGLALVKELTRLHGGTVQVESALGEGSTFTIRIPRGSAHLPRGQVHLVRPATKPYGANLFVEDVLGWLPETPPSTTPREQGPAFPTIRPQSIRPPGRPPERLLVVDDSPEMRRYLTRVLGDAYQVEVAANGVAALASLRARRPDLVVTDVMMPEMDGLGLLRELRADPMTRLIPVILLSARAGEEAALEALGIGADDYLVKPFSARELVARVRTHLELVRAREEAVESQLKDAFLGLASHELRTPLTTLKLGIQHLARKQEKAGAPASDFFVRAQRALSRMETLVEDLLTVSTLKAGRLTLRLARHDLVEICRSAAAEQAAIFGRQVTLDLPDTPLEVLVDLDRIGQVVSHLLSNALKFSEQDRPVTLSLRRSENDAVLAVRDYGHGIAPDRILELFERYYRVGDVEALTRSGSRLGLGLGLFLSKGIVTQHGGTIRVESTIGAGSTFTVTLPLSPRLEDRH